MSHGRLRATLTSARALSPSVRSLVLSPQGGALSFIAGQWVNVHLETDAGALKRAYSVASAPGDGTLELAVTRVPDGALSPLLHDLPVGSELELDGPHGMFTRDERARAEPALFVATGTGLSPFRSMLREELSGQGGPPITLLFGCRTEADILWREELEAWARAVPRFRLEVTLSRPERPWAGRVGHVQAHLVALARELGAPATYICGLSKMVADVRALLKGELGYDRKRIHSERYD